MAVKNNERIQQLIEPPTMMIFTANIYNKIKNITFVFVKQVSDVIVHINPICVVNYTRILTSGEVLSRYVSSRLNNSVAIIDNYFCFL